MANHTEDCAFQQDQGGSACDCGFHNVMNGEKLKNPPAGLETTSIKSEFDIRKWVKAIRFTANQGDTSRWGLQGIIVELCDRVDQLNEELTSQGAVNAEVGKNRCDPVKIKEIGEERLKSAWSNGRTQDMTWIRVALNRIGDLEVRLKEVSLIKYEENLEGNEQNHAYQERITELEGENLYLKNKLVDIRLSIGSEVKSPSVMVKLRRALSVELAVLKEADLSLKTKGERVQIGNKVGFCRGFAYGARYASASLHIEHSVPSCPLSGVDLSKTWILGDLIFEKISYLGGEIKAGVKGDDSSLKKPG